MRKASTTGRCRCWKCEALVAEGRRLERLRTARVIRKSVVAEGTHNLNAFVLITELQRATRSKLGRRKG